MCTPTEYISKYCHTVSRAALRQRWALGKVAYHSFRLSPDKTDEIRDRRPIQRNVKRRNFLRSVNSLKRPASISIHLLLVRPHYT